MPEEGQKKYRIENFEAGLMIGVALLADAIPVVGELLLGGGIILWMQMRGLEPFSFKPKRAGKRFANFGLNTIGEAATGSIWLGVTVFTIIMIGMSRVEDKTGLSIPTPEKITKSGVKKVAKQAVADNVVKFPEQNSGSVDGIKERKAA